MLNLVGLGLGPLFVGVVSDWLGGGRNGLQLGMLLEALVYLPAAACYIVASRSVDADVSDVGRAASGSVDPHLDVSSDAASVPQR